MKTMRVYTPACLPPIDAARRGWPWTGPVPALPTAMPSGKAWPRVSVVTPSYNQGRFIEETMRSVLLQGYPNLEYIVIDGGSTDETKSILERYAACLSYWVSEPDGGQAHAINKGWKQAQGDILAWLNSDDVYQPGAVSIAVTRLLERPEVGLVYGEAYHVTETGDIIERYPTESYSRCRLGDTCYICQPTTFLRRGVIDTIGYLNESLRYCMDYDYWIRASNRYPFAHIPQYLALSRLHSDCKTVNQSVARAREALDMLHQHYGAVPPLKVGGYARALLESEVQSNGMFKKRALPYILRTMGICMVEFFRYNRKMPLSQASRWIIGLLEGIKKFRMFRA